MDFENFKQSLSNENPSSNLPKILIGLWHDGKGDWDKGHDLIDGDEHHNAAWAHAYMHRKEGDIWNADYWYRRAGRVRPDCTLDEEWEDIVRACLLN